MPLKAPPLCQIDTSVHAQIFTASNGNWGFNTMTQELVDWIKNITKNKKQTQSDQQDY